MGVEYSMCLGVGFMVKQEDLVTLFSTEVQEQSHLEDRFDPKTGAKLQPVKVIDKHHDVFLMWKGEMVDHIESLVRLIAEDFGGSGMGARVSYWDAGEDNVYIFGLLLKQNDDGEDFGQLSTGGSVLLKNIPSVEALEPVRKYLTDLGLPIDEPVVKVCVEIS